MFYRGVVGEEVTGITASASLNMSNQNEDDKNVSLINEFASTTKDLIKQEPNDKHSYKFDFAANNTSSGVGSGSIGGSSSSSSSSSSTSSASTSPSASSTNSSSNRKYSYHDQHPTPSAKRKSSDHHHHHHHNHHHHHKSNQHQVYHQKPVYSEFLSSKCILFIYYKGDISLVIDDHFKKSISLSAAKSSASISPLSLSSASTSPLTSKANTKSNFQKTSEKFI